MNDLLSMRKNPESYKKFFAENDKLGSLLGAKLLSISAEECLCEYVVSPSHFNPNGILHGGALYAAMDSSQGAFVHFILDPAFQAAATGTATIRYEAPLREGKIQIRTWLKGQERRKIYVNSEARDANGRVVATLEEIWIAMPGKPA